MFNTEEIERLRPIAEHSDLFPIGAGDKRKAPGYAGRKIKWRHQPGHTIESLKEPKGHIAIGVKTGQAIYCADFDGSSSLHFGKRNNMCPHKVEAWKVSRTTSSTYLKLLFRPTAGQIEMLPVNNDGTRYFDFKKRTGINEALEHFYSPARQVIVLGKHYTSGGEYEWLAGPEALSPPPDAWWNRTVELVKQHQENLPAGSKAKSSGKDWFRLDECPICGRSAHLICQQHRDERTIRCFHGLSYAPPTGLKAGQVIPGDWAFTGKIQNVGFGEFSVFVKHKPTPLQQIRRWRRG